MTLLGMGWHYMVWLGGARHDLGWNIIVWLGKGWHGIYWLDMG